MLDTRAFRHVRSSNWGKEPFVIDPPTSPEVLRTWFPAERFKTLPGSTKRMYAARFNVPDVNYMRLHEIDDLFCPLNKRLPMFPDFMEWVYDPQSPNQCMLAAKRLHAGKPPKDAIDPFQSVFSGEPEDLDYSPWLPSLPLATDKPCSPTGHREPYDGEDVLHTLLRDLAMKQATLHFALQRATHVVKSSHSRVERIRSHMQAMQLGAEFEKVFGAPQQPPATGMPGSSAGHDGPTPEERAIHEEKLFLKLSQAKLSLKDGFAKVQQLQAALQTEQLKTNDVLAAIVAMNCEDAEKQADYTRSEAYIRDLVLRVHSKPLEHLGTVSPMTLRASQHNSSPACDTIELHRTAKRTREEDSEDSDPDPTEINDTPSRKRLRLLIPQPPTSNSAPVPPHRAGPSTPRPLKRTRDAAGIDDTPVPGPFGARDPYTAPPAAKKAATSFRPPQKLWRDSKRVLVNRDTGECAYFWDANGAERVLRRWEAEEHERARAQAVANERVKAAVSERTAQTGVTGTILASAAALGRRVWGAVGPSAAGSRAES